jgi:hypothetical protein
MINNCSVAPVIDHRGMGRLEPARMAMILAHRPKNAGYWSSPDRRDRSRQAGDDLDRADVCPIHAD